VKKFVRLFFFVDDIEEKKNVTEKSLDNQGTPVHWWSFRYYGHSPQTNSSLQFYQTPSKLTLLERATLIGELTDGIPLGGKMTRGSFDWRSVTECRLCHSMTHSQCLFRKLQIFISQTTDSHFANYRFSFRKLQILISRTTDFHFVSFGFVSQSTVSPSSLSMLTVFVRIWS